MAGHPQLSERRFRAIQPDGGLPRETLLAPSRLQRRILCGRLPKQSVVTASRVPGLDRLPGQAYLGDNHDREHNLWSTGRRAGSGLGGRFSGYEALVGKGGWETQTHPHLPIFFHLYESQGILMADEELDYRTAKEMVGYRITPNPDSWPGTDENEAVPTPTPSPQPGPSSRTPNRRRKSTYRAPEGSPPFRSRGPSSPIPPKPQPRAQQPASRPDPQPQGAQPKRGQEWVEKPFIDVLRSIWQAQIQYESMEEALEQIGSELGVRSNGIIPKIRSLPKAREVEELRAWIARLLKENADLQTWVADRDRKIEEAEAQTAVAVEEQTRAEAKREKWHGVSRKFFDFVGFAGDVVTKARLYN